MEDHSGRVLVDSGVGGTTFKLYFPLSDKLVEVKEEEEESCNLIGNSDHILAGDDEDQPLDIAAKC